MIDTRVIVVALSTLKRRVCPALIDVVQPVSVVFCDLVALDIVGTADAVILSASVGG